MHAQERSGNYASNLTCREMIYIHKDGKMEKNGNEKKNKKMRQKHRNYSFTSKSVNYKVLGTV